MLRPFIEKYYTVLFLIFLGVIVCLSYLFGLEQGRAKGAEGVVFSYDDSRFKQAAIGKDFPDPVDKSLVEKSFIEQPPLEGKGVYVGSKNGTKYYTPGCSGVSRIKPENYVWFQSAEDATLQGYSKGSC